jgi:hypothetical protein
MSVWIRVLTPPVEEGRRPVRKALTVAVLALAVLSSANAFATSAGQPFPSNLYTQPDSTQITGLRVDLPSPNCATNPSDCADIALLDQLDGFNLQPRISVPFSGPIDLSSVSSSTVFLVGGGRQIGINRIVWEPAANTLHFTSDELLAQDTAYLLVVTRGVLDSSGTPVDDLNFRRDWNYGQTKDAQLKRYRKSVLDALPSMLSHDVEKLGVADLSLFTTQSVDAISRKIRAQLPGGAASFARGTHGEQTVFPLASIAGIQFARQTGTAPVFSTGFLPTPALNVFPGSVGTVAFGSYSSPDYENADQVIPAVGTLTGTPVVQSTNQLEFTLFVPAGMAPAGGWPVAIFGHGFTDSKEGAPWAVASSFAARGIATIAINVVGHGGGALGTYTVLRTAGAPVVLPSGGRGIDQNGDNKIDSTEGVFATGAQSLIGPRDGLRQTVIDLMQLVQVLRGGVDVDGDGTPDLSTSRIYYAGQSFGGIYGVQLLGLEPDVRAGVPNVAGGSPVEASRLGAFRGLVGVALLTRVPDLYNAVPNFPYLTNFIENLPLRNLPAVVDNVPGASAIQALLDNTEWAQQAANPVAYAPLITRPVIIQFARGDETVPNPTTSAILRAGGLAPRATLFRNDLAYALNPAVGKNPHIFLTNIVNPAAAAYAIGAQTQIAVFFASDGTITLDPDGAGPFFEVPTSMVPEDLAFIP